VAIAAHPQSLRARPRHRVRRMVRGNRHGRPHAGQLRR
jgi:hypothetical protein